MLDVLYVYRQLGCGVVLCCGGLLGVRAAMSGCALGFVSGSGCVLEWHGSMSSTSAMTLHQSICSLCTPPVFDLDRAAAGPHVRHAEGAAGHEAEPGRHRRG
jgi:hypothetical protein